MNTPSIEMIERLLVAGSLNRDEASRRAPLVFEDFQWIGFDNLRLSASTRAPFSSYCIPEYFFGDTGFSIHNAEQGEFIEAKWIGGTGMDRGHLQLFSRASDIGRDILPHLWHQRGKLRGSLRNPTQHLDTVEEVWWLDRWYSPERVRASLQLNAGSNKDVDWCFTLANGAVAINMEVKRLPSDALRHTKGRTFKTNVFENYCKKNVTPKFRRSQADEVNVLALSLIGEIDHCVQSALEDWLVKRQDVIDAILVTSRESSRKSSFDVHLRNDKAREMRLFLKYPTEEDQRFAFSLLVPYDNPEVPKMLRP